MLSLIENNRNRDMNDLSGNDYINKVRETCAYLDNIINPADNSQKILIANGNSGGPNQKQKVPISSKDPTVDCTRTISDKGTYSIVKETINNQAVKIFLTDEDNPAFSFISEMNILINCQHPNLIKLLEFGVNVDKVFIVYEKASCDLSTYSNLPSCSLQNRHYITKQIIEGLYYLHSMYVIHNDLKPANILLYGAPVDSFKVTICDFGSAVMFPNCYNINVQCKTTTPQYEAPEQILEICHWYPADIWSFGCIMWYIYANKHFMISTGNLKNRMERIISILGNPFAKWHKTISCVHANIISQILEENEKEGEKGGNNLPKEMQKENFVEPVIAILSKIFVYIPEKRWKIDKIKQHFEEIVEKSTIEGDMPPDNQIRPGDRSDRPSGAQTAAQTGDQNSNQLSTSPIKRRQSPTKSNLHILEKTHTNPSNTLEKTQTNPSNTLEKAHTSLSSNQKTVPSLFTEKSLLDNLRAKQRPYKSVAFENITRRELINRLLDYALIGKMNIQSVLYSIHLFDYVAYMTVRNVNTNNGVKNTTSPKTINRNIVGTGLVDNSSSSSGSSSSSSSGSSSSTQNTFDYDTFIIACLTFGSNIHQIKSIYYSEYDRKISEHSIIETRFKILNLVDHNLIFPTAYDYKFVIGEHLEKNPIQWKLCKSIILSLYIEGFVFEMKLEELVNVAWTRAINYSSETEGLPRKLNFD